MSYRKVREIIEHSLAEGSERLTLLIIAEHCDDDGYGFPSVELLAKEANISHRYATRLVRRLVDRGELVIVRRGCSRRSNSYRLNITPNTDRAKWFSERRVRHHEPHAADMDALRTPNSRSVLTPNGSSSLTPNPRTRTPNRSSANTEREFPLTIREPSRNHHPNHTRTGGAQKESMNAEKDTEHRRSSAPRRSPPPSRSPAPPRETVWSLNQRIDAATARIAAIRAIPENHGLTIAGTSILTDEAREEIADLKANIKRWEGEILQHSCSKPERETGSVSLVASRGEVRS